VTPQTLRLLFNDWGWEHLRHWVKLVMIKIHVEFSKHNFKSKMLLQGHDELVFDAHRSEIEIIKPIILNCMQTALALPNDVPTDAELDMGDNWLEAH